MRRFVPLQLCWSQETSSTDFALEKTCVFFPTRVRRHGRLEHFDALRTPENFFQRVTLMALLVVPQVNLYQKLLSTSSTFQFRFAIMRELMI